MSLNGIPQTLIDAYENRQSDPKALMGEVRTHLKMLAFSEDSAASAIREYIFDVSDGYEEGETNPSLKMEADRLYSTVRALRYIRTISEDFMAHAKEPVDGSKLQYASDDPRVEPGRARLTNLEILKDLAAEWDEVIAPEWKGEFGETAPELLARLDEKGAEVTTSREALMARYKPTSGGSGSRQV